MPFVEENERKIFYQVTGEGEPLVMIHGIALDSNIWGYLPGFLSKKYKVITYDLRGHGQSFAPDSGYSYNDHIGDLKLLLEKLKIEKTHILAHSLGGAIAVKFALQTPGRVLSMFLAAPHVVGYIDYKDWPNVYRTARTIDIDQAKIQWDRFRLFDHLVDDSPEKKLFLQCLENFSGKVWTDPKAFKYIEENDFKLLDKLESKILLLCGRDDHDFLPLAKILNAYSTNGTLYEIPDCSHMIHLEKSDIFKRELKGFFEL